VLCCCCVEEIERCREAVKAKLARRQAQVSDLNEVQALLSKLEVLMIFFIDTHIVSETKNSPGTVSASLQCLYAFSSGILSWPELLPFFVEALCTAASFARLLFSSV